MSNKIDWDAANRREHKALLKKSKPKRRTSKKVHPNSMAALKWNRTSWDK